MSPGLMPELALAAACSRWPPCERVDAAVRSAAAAPIDWERFAGIVIRNRIAGLALAALTKAHAPLPPEAAARLALESNQAAVNSLTLAREAAKLQREFDAEGLPALILKGAALAVLAYADVGRKDSRDVDLLVRPQDVVAARRLLGRLGYRTAAPQGLDDAGFARWAAHLKECTLRHDRSGVEVDLHWRLVDNELLLTNVDAESAAQIVPVGPGFVRTLADGPLFAYLCVHGGAHNWARLKWLADLNAFLGSRDHQQIERLYDAADSHGAGRPARLALLLCGELFELDLPASLRRAIANDRICGFLARNTLAGLQCGGGLTEPAPYTWPWLRAMIGTLFLGPGPKYFWRQIGIVWTSADDRARIRLPDRLALFYHVLRVPLWGLRLGRRVVKGSPR